MFLSFSAASAVIPSRPPLASLIPTTISSTLGQSQEIHSSSTSSEPSLQVTTPTSRTINQTLQSINNNNNNNSTIAKSKIHLNVDQQISSDSKDDELLSHEPNNNTNKSNTSSSSRTYRYHPVSRRGAEFISPQVPGFRSFGESKKYITQKNK
jgi:hypothetical protein